MLKKISLFLFFYLHIVVFCRFFGGFTIFANNLVEKKTVVKDKAKSIDVGNSNIDKRGNAQVSRKDVSDSEVRDARKRVNKMRLNIALPQPLKDVIILDAGHGYMDSGGGVNGCYEYIPNAQLVYKLANLLVDTGFFEVYLTHPLEYAGEKLKIDTASNSNNRFIHIILPEIPVAKNAKVKTDKKGKSQYSSCYRASVVSAAMTYTIKKLRESRSKIYALSLHHNVSEKNCKEGGDKSAGLIVYYSRESADAKYKKENINFSKNILDFCFNLYGDDSNSGKSPRCNNFLVTQVGSPSVLCEVDFIDNKNRQSKILSDIHQNRMARGLKNAIMKTYGYETRWANVKLEKDGNVEGVKFVVKNLNKSVDNLKLAIYGEGKISKTSESAEWFDGVREQNGDFVIKLPKIEKHGKVIVDVYSKIGEKLVFIDSDFNEFKI